MVWDQITRVLPECTWAFKNFSSLGDAYWRDTMDEYPWEHFLGGGAEVVAFPLNIRWNVQPGALHVSLEGFSQFILHKHEGRTSAGSVGLILKNDTLHIERLLKLWNKYAFDCAAGTRQDKFVWGMQAEILKQQFQFSLQHRTHF